VWAPSGHRPSILRMLNACTAPLRAAERRYAHSVRSTTPMPSRALTGVSSRPAKPGSAAADAAGAAGKARDPLKRQRRRSRGR
jgi:hypothetical protein